MLGRRHRSPRPDPLPTPVTFSPSDKSAMHRALELARRGEGRVEPNPMVGAVIASANADGRIVGEGWHDRFGGPHAEPSALAAAGPLARGGTLYVTLEPCCHHGKTPPCTDAIIAAGITRVVAAVEDPFPAVGGGGIAALRRAGIVVETGLLAAEALRLTAAYRKLLVTGTPWVIGKWAMSLDGLAAAPPDADRWISSAASRAIVHALRGRVDAILVGIGTAVVDDPLLTARPAGSRAPLRIVLDSLARLPLTSQLVRTARDVPLLVAVGPAATADRIAALRAAGCEVWEAEGDDHAARFRSLLRELGARRMTNLLVEGGPEVLRTLFADSAIDEVWAFVAPKILGAAAAAESLPTIPAVPPLDIEEVSQPGGDILVRGLVRRPA